MPIIKTGVARRQTRLAAAAMAAALALTSVPAWSATKTWDLDSAGHNNGQINNGGGMWNTGGSATANWTTNGGTTNTTWSDLDDAVFGGAGSVGAAGTITLSGNQIINSLTFNNVPSGNFVFNPAGNQFQYSGSTVAITQNSSSGVTINPNWNASDTATLTLGGSGAGVVTITGPIIEKSTSKILALTKTGSSNFVLTSTSSTWSDVTNINGGTLTVNGTIAGGGAFNVNSGAKLAGTGTITKNIAINSGATLSPGGDGTNANVGAITTNNGGSTSHSWGTNSTYLWEIKDATAAAGTGYDTVNVTGTLAVNATNVAGNKMTIKVVSHGAVTGWNRNLVWNWDISTATTTTGFSADKFVLDVTDFVDDNSADVGSFQVTQSGTHIRVSYVPEPSAALLAGVGAVSVLRRRRRRS